MSGCRIVVTGVQPQPLQFYDAWAPWLWVYPESWLSALEPDSVCSSLPRFSSRRKDGTGSGSTQPLASAKARVATHPFISSAAGIGVGGEGGRREGKSKQQQSPWLFESRDSGQMWQWAHRAHVELLEGALLTCQWARRAHSTCSYKAKWSLITPLHTLWAELTKLVPHTTLDQELAFYICLQWQKRIRS